jgi:hypothetical protein
MPPPDNASSTSLTGQSGSFTNLKRRSMDIPGGRKHSASSYRSPKNISVSSLGEALSTQSSPLSGSFGTSVRSYTTADGWDFKSIDTVSSKFKTILDMIIRYFRQLYLTDAMFPELADPAVGTVMLDTACEMAGEQLPATKLLRIDQTRLKTFVSNA